MDGAGDSIGDFTIEKPEGAVVVAAYLVMATFDYMALSDFSDYTLAGVQPTFTDSAVETQAVGFQNFFADVTNIVAPIVDAGPVGSQTMTVVEGDSGNAIEGSALIVIFDDPAVTVSSIAFYFGTSATTGDEFVLNFAPLTQSQTEDLRLAIGDAYSFGEAQNTTINVNGQTLTESAGHFDDCTEFVPGSEPPASWTCDNGGLITVGGVGDDLTNPVLGGLWTTITDDELYSLTPFVSVGDTELRVATFNPSQNDNVFMAAFYLDEVELDGATRLARPPVLAATGVDASAASFAALALLSVLIGAVVLAVSKRPRKSRASQ